MDFYTSDGVLYHHGVKGQEWGVKNGPPYPLSDEKKKEIVNYAVETHKRLGKEREIDKKSEELGKIRKEELNSEAYKKYHEMSQISTTESKAAYNYATKKAVKEYGKEDQIGDEEYYKIWKKYQQEYKKDHPDTYTMEEVGKQLEKVYEKSSAMALSLEKEEKQIKDDVNKLVKEKYGVTLEDLYKS